MEDASPKELMATLHCLMYRKKMRHFASYKKRFWVLRDGRKCLEVFKNDQCFEPLTTIYARDIKQVSFTGDKTDHFYSMTLLTRLDYNVVFRMRSAGERELWANGIRRLMGTYTSENRKTSVLQSISRRCRMVSHALRVEIAVDASQLLSTFPDALLQFVVEAIDVALGSVAVLVRNSQIQLPRNYILVLRGGGAAAAVSTDPKYDPVKSTVTCTVHLYDSGRGVQFRITEPEEVLQLIQSTFFRNPLIEGWLEMDEERSEVCAEIRAALSRPDLPITFQWGKDVDKGALDIELYLEKCVNTAFLEDTLAQIRAATEDLAAERARGLQLHEQSQQFAPPATATAAADPHVPRTESLMSLAAVGTARGPRSNGARPLDESEPRSPPASKAHRRTASNVLLSPDSSQPPLMPSATTGHFRHATYDSFSGQPPPPPPPPQQQQQLQGYPPPLNSFALFTGGSSGCFASAFDMRHPISVLLGSIVSDISIRIERSSIISSVRPKVLVNYTSDFYYRYRPALLLTSKYEDVFNVSEKLSNLFSDGASGSTSGDVGKQIYFCGFHAYLQQCISNARNALIKVFDKRVVIVINWVQLLTALHQLGVSVSYRDLPLLVTSVTATYAQRVQQTYQLLQAVRVAGKDGSAGLFSDRSGTLLDMFFKHVEAIRVDFVPYPNRQLSSEAQPSVEGGVLTDCFFCVETTKKPELLQMLARSEGSALKRLASAGSRGSAGLLPNCTLVPACSSLGSWCEAFLCGPDHPPPRAPPASDRQSVEDIFASESDDDSDSINELDLNYGDAVAFERQAEIQVLSRERVINSVYDSQGPVLDLKISSEAIGTAINSLSRAFKGKKVSKHSLDRILTCNLQRLRDMYTNRGPRRGLSLLLEEDAVALLQDFCEYAETCSDVPRLVAEHTDCFLVSRDAEPAVAVAAADKGNGGSSAGDMSAGPLGRSPTAVSGGTSTPSYLAIRAQHLRNQEALTNNANTTTANSTGNRRSSMRTLAFESTTEGESPSHEVVVQHRNGSLMLTSAVSSTAALAEGEVRMFGFPAIADMALNTLLPREAVVARRASRQGLMFGLERTGKTLLLDCLRGVLRNTLPSVGLSAEVVCFMEWVFTIHELGGRESFRQNWKYYTSRLEQLDFLIFVLDTQERPAYAEAYDYLCSVARAFPGAPLLVVFNNCRQVHRRILVHDTEVGFGLDAFRRKNRDRVILSCVCDVTVVHSANSSIPEQLAQCLRELSDHLRRRSPPGLVPSVPKEAEASSADTPNGAAAAPTVTSPVSALMSQSMSLRGTGTAAGGGGAFSSSSNRAPPAGSVVSVPDLRLSEATSPASDAGHLAPTRNAREMARVGAAIVEEQRALERTWAERARAEAASESLLTQSYSEVCVRTPKAKAPGATR